MAKTSKKPKAAKKPAKAKAAAKPKKAAPKAKKPVAKKASKPAKPAKAAPAKKVAPKKAVAKAAPVKKIEIKRASAPAKKAPVSVKATMASATAKPTQAQLNFFPPLPTQRPIAHKPAKGVAVTDDRTRYSDEELKEFETLILGKLEKARAEYKILKETLNRNNDEGTDATSGGNTKVLEDGAETAEKENLSQLAARQQKYITNLENALVRIKNGTYGICSVTGKLISKERLIAVPHTTQSIEAKMMQTD